jgi:hypothetical protein
MNPKLKLSEKLFEALNQSSVSYCHWKGNWALDQALSGEKDLDLLVERRSLAKTHAILLSLGFKPCVPRGEPATRGAVHYYGLDQATGRLVHAHVCSQAATGEGFFGTHISPSEEVLLNATLSLGQVKVPSENAEFVVFVIRALLKYGTMPDLATLWRHSRNIKAEFEWLRGRADLSQATELFKRFWPGLDDGFFVNCVDTLNGRGSTLRKIFIARRLSSRLYPFERYSWFRRVPAYARWAWHEFRRLITCEKSRVLKGGGAVVAIVGPEASGKSTFISECQRWLAEGLPVTTIHLGKPPSTLWTAPFNSLAPTIRKLIPGLRTTRYGAGGLPGVSAARSGDPSCRPSLLHAIRAVCIARDRRSLAMKARRLAARGNIVLCDRYPSETPGIDGPRLLARADHRSRSSILYERLARVEEKLYKQIAPPDVIVKLRVSVETAVKRNRERVKAGKEDDSYVEARHRQYQDWQLSRAKSVYEINGEQPLPDTLRQVKQVIWDSI